MNFVEAQKPNHVWKLIDGEDDDENMYLIPSPVYCERVVHYIVSEKPWVSEDVRVCYFDVSQRAS